MQMVIEVKDLKVAQDRLAKIGVGLRDGMAPAFEAIGKLGSTYFAGIGFSSRGQAYGAPWQPLADATVADKLKHWRGKPIMVRTGAMMNGFTFEPGVTGVRLYNEVPYFKYHQSAQERGDKLPRRVMMGVNDSFKAMVRTAIVTQIDIIIAAGGL